VVAEITTVPFATPITTPVEEFTVAIDVSDDDQVIVWFVAFPGITEVERLIELVGDTIDDPIIDAIPVTVIVAIETDNVLVAVKLPSIDVAVIVAVPTPRDTIKPLASIEITLESDEDQSILGLDTFEGNTLVLASNPWSNAVNTSRFNCTEIAFIPVARTIDVPTFTVKYVVDPPRLAVIVAVPFPTPVIEQNTLEVILLIVTTLVLDDAHVNELSANEFGITSANNTFVSPNVSEVIVGKLVEPTFDVHVIPFIPVKVLDEFTTRK
jgi:hypothetical protein